MGLTVIQSLLGVKIYATSPGPVFEMVKDNDVK
jgi:hypothetical protein